MNKHKGKMTDFQEVYIAPDEPVFTTGVVCRLLNIPVWVLKQLDKEEIVSPPRKAEGKARLYSKKELKMVQRCWIYMKSHKVKVHGLKVILRIEDGTFEGIDF
jgi:DNA-binding transcriptional MerR regulator